jgi:predicted nucleic acid-binding protein
MGWVEMLHGKLVGLDTAPIIYYMEEKPVYVDMLDPFFQAITRGDISVVTSLLTLLEVLVLPVRNGDKVLEQKYRKILFNIKGLQTLAISPDIIEEATRLRAFHNVRTPDSIQMATAITAKASFFLTNDIKLPSLPSLSLLALDKLRAEPYS